VTAAAESASLAAYWATAESPGSGDDRSHAWGKAWVRHEDSHGRYGDARARFSGKRRHERQAKVTIADATVAIIGTGNIGSRR
jgi:hypothetical protein